MKYRSEDVLALARTLWGECRGEPREGQIAVAWVIRNRVENPGWWSRQRDGIPDDTIEAVCLDRNQFSCWWDKQASRVRTRTREQIGELYQLAYDVLDDQISDPTEGADHYHTILRPEYARKWPPTWAEKRIGKRFGSHLFYKIGLR
jgi:spore germination cell wall hydrolase CwlJ-like protein